MLFQSGENQWDSFHVWVGFRQKGARDLLERGVAIWDHVTFACLNQYNILSAMVTKIGCEVIDLASYNYWM